MKKTQKMWKVSKASRQQKADLTSWDSYEDPHTAQKMVPKEWLNLLLIGLYLLSMLLSFVFYGGLGSGFQEAYQVGLFSCVFLLPLWLFLRRVKWELERPKSVLFLGLVFFGLTMTAVLISVHINTYMLWLGGCIFLTVLFPTGIGIGFFLFFGCLFCFINNATISYEIFMFLFGIALCSLVSLIKKGTPAPIVVLAALIIYTLLFFVFTRGSSAYFEWQSLCSMIGQAVFLIMAYGLYSILEQTGSLFEDWWEI